MDTPKILLIEDNPDTQVLIQTILAPLYTVICAGDAIQGIEIAKKDSPHLILLDIMLPHMDGYEACRILKSDPKTQKIPIIFLSAKGEVEDITHGLELGAEDYIPKPFDIAILKARIKSKLKPLPSNSNLIELGKLKINLENRNVEYDKMPIELTLTEYDILKLLALHHKQVLSRLDIVKELHSKKAPSLSERKIDGHIRSIRKKAPMLNRHLLSVYGKGYQLDLD